LEDFSQLGLKSDLLDGIYAAKFQKPAQIQQLAIPAILQNPDKSFIGQAQSGSGKTLAFIISMLSVVDDSKEETQALCIAPTRELVVQNFQVASKLAETTNIKILLDVPESRVPDKFKQQIVIGTPGRINSSLLKQRFMGYNLRMFVIDEADEMLNLQGQKEQVMKIFSKLSPNCQFCLFSATFNPTVRELCTEIIREPSIKLFLKPDELTVEKLIQTKIICKEEEKFSILNEVFSYVNIGQCIIFALSRRRAREIHQFLISRGHGVSLLHGADMAAATRDITIQNFKEGKNRILVSTNVLARGIDVLQVSLVINFDLPLTRDGRPDAETYLHRVGRTARYNKPGLAINFVHDDFSAQTLRIIENTYSLTITTISPDQLSDVGEKLERMATSYKDKKKNN
jgi:ATP-dependent RNA helicase DDX19/DBP5